MTLKEIIDEMDKNYAESIKDMPLTCDYCPNESLYSAIKKFKYAVGYTEEFETPCIDRTTGLIL